MESHCCISYLLSFSERRWTSFLIFSFFSFSLSSCSVSRFFCFVQLDHFLWYCFILVGSFPFVVTSIWLFFFTYFINFGILLFLRHTMETATYSSSWLWLFCHCDFSPVSPVYLPFHLCMHMYMPSVYFGFVTTHAAHFLPVSPLSSCIFLFSFFSLHSPSSSISFSTNFPFHCSYTFSRIPFFFPLLSRPPPLPSSQYFLPLHTSSSSSSHLPWRQHWHEGGGDPEEPERPAASAWLPAGPQPPVLAAPAGPQPEPPGGVDLPQCGLFPGQTPLQLSGLKQLSVGSDWLKT